MEIKKIIKKILPKNFFNIIRDVIYPEKIDILEDRLNLLFLMHYQNIADSKLSQKIAFKNSEFKIYSKHGCDGILAYIFSRIGMVNHNFVEIGVEDGRECNTANLSLNFGWRGMLIDANEKWIKSAKDFYKKKLKENARNVTIAACFITKENVNQLLRDYDAQGEIDLLSIDIDGNDYWVWKAIQVIDPRVVVMEYNATFGQKSMTIKYNENFYFENIYKKNPLYFGASLSALYKLAKEKGYVLVACDCHGHDAFFVRKDVIDKKFVELSPEEAFYPNPLALEKFGSLENQFKQIEHLEFETI